MEQILVEQGFQQSGCTTNECMVEVGKLIGVEKIVSGSISVRLAISFPYLQE